VKKGARKKWVNKRERPKIVPMKHGKGLSLYWTENWALY